MRFHEIFQCIWTLSYNNTEKYLFKLLNYTKGLLYNSYFVHLYDINFLFFLSIKAENSCRVTERHGHKLMTSLVGDSLLEPFWPTGTGCARGFFGGLDACWLMRTMALGKLNSNLRPYLTLEIKPCVNVSRMSPKLLRT